MENSVVFLPIKRSIIPQKIKLYNLANAGKITSHNKICGSSLLPDAQFEIFCKNMFLRKFNLNCSVYNGKIT